MIMGEYAVLEGVPAVVAAVGRRAYARTRGTDDMDAPAEARAAYARVERAWGALGSRPTVDVSELRAQGAKLGLGSSAAAAAAAAGLALAQHGREIATPEGRAAVFDAAFQGHRDIAPQGSGADVAASVYGGVIRFQKTGQGAETAPLSWPGLRVQVVWTGQEARTSSFLERVGALAAAQPSQYRRLIDTLGAHAECFLRALQGSDLQGVLNSTHAYGEAMGALGEAADVSIITDTLRTVSELARAAGGAAKPSGAGGGDVALALFPDTSSEDRFRHMCQEHNFALLLLGWGAPGVRIEGADPSHEASR